MLFFILQFRLGAHLFDGTFSVTGDLLGATFGRLDALVVDVAIQEVPDDRTKHQAQYQA